MPTANSSKKYLEWASDAVWYQIFPERFRNGDDFNQPTRDSLVNPNEVPMSWCVMDWRKPWNERASWEQEVSQRFDDSIFNCRYGGDLQGVIDSLDYLQNLGVKAHSTINPLFYSPSHHKYDGSSFHHIDPFFGPDPQKDLAIIRSENIDSKEWQGLMLTVSSSGFSAKPSLGICVLLLTASGTTRGGDSLPLRTSC